MYSYTEKSLKYLFDMNIYPTHARESLFLIFYIRNTNACNESRKEDQIEAATHTS